MSQQYDMTNPYEIAKFIKDATKSTPVKAYVKGKLEGISSESVRIFGEGEFYVLFGESKEVIEFLEANKAVVTDFELENDRRNSAIPLLDLKYQEARIEPGAMIRDRVAIGKNAVIMMGAVINIGSEIGEGTMIDMNAVLGARATIGKNAHVGAGAVIAGVLEPPSATPVIVEDDALIGANAVVLFNRLYEPDINIDEMKMTSAEVFSSPTDLRHSLRWISLVSDHHKEIHLSASTGVHDSKSIIKLLLAGADTVQVCSILYKKGIDYLDQMLNEMESWMDSSGYESVDSLRGKMSYKNHKDPQIWERSQFMRYFSSRD